jgi:hypothetical protein
MPITPFLRHEAFGPEQIELMSAAFLDACAELGLENGRADPTTQLVAARIIELAQRGIKSQAELSRSAVDGFRPYTG